MATELAVAYVTIIPSLKGAAKQIESALSGVDSSSIGRKIGDQLSGAMRASLNVESIGARISEIGDKFSGVGSKLTNGITKPAAIAGGVVAGLVGALGFKRLVGIDTARGQFKGLGHDADAVMKQVDKGVTNTALSMADGASIAVGILATGNLPLKDLEAQLKRVANVSAAYGVDSSQAGYLLNNVLTKNKVTYGDLSQMVQNGIPILSDLAKHYGVTGDEIEGMASRGEISIEDFNTVLDNNAGKAAEEYAKTWQGVTSNIVSNIGKLGAEVLQGVFPRMKTEMQGFLDFLKTDDAKAFAADVGGALTSAFTTVIDAIKGVISWWGSLSPGMQDFITKLGLVAVAAGPVLSIVGKVTSVVGTLTSGVGKTIGAFARMAPVVKSGAETLQIVGLYALDYIKAGARMVASLAAQAGAWIAQKTAVIASTVASKAAAVAQWAMNAAMNANPIMLVVTAIAALVAGLVWFFTQTELGQEIWANFTRFLSEAWTNITTFLSEAWTNITGFFTTGQQMVNDIWNGLWTGVSSFLTTTWENIKAFFASALQWVVDMFLNWTVYGLIIKNWDAIAKFFTDVWNNIVNGIKTAIIFVLRTIADVTTKIRSVWNTVWSGIKGFFTTIWNGIVSAAKGFFGKVKTQFTNVTDFIKGIPEKVKGFFTGIGTWLKDSGKALIDGFIAGITAAFKGAKKFVSDGLKNIRDLFPFSPAKDGPFSGRGWVAFSGQSVGETFATSLVTALHDGKKDIRDELSGIQSEFDDVNGVGSGFTVRSAMLASGDGAGGIPSAITLVDTDGSILTRARVIADGAVTAASAAGRRSLRSGATDRRQW